MEAAEFLKRTELFSGIDDNLLAPVCRLATVRTYDEGTSVFVQGDTASEFYIVKIGTVAINKRVAGGRKRNLSNLGPGEVFGELALFDADPRSADAEVLTTSEIIAIPNDKFLQALEADPRLAALVLQKVVLILCRRLRATDELLDQGVIWGFRMES